MDPPNRTDVFVTVIGGKELSKTIGRSEGHVGFESGETRPPDFADVQFVDYPFTKEDLGFEHHLDVVAEYEPAVTVAPDIEKGRTLEAVEEQADRLAEHAETVVVVPKDVEPEAVPDRFRVGLPLADFGSDSPHEIADFIGVGDVHLLGGVPTLQHAVARTYVDVASVDGSSVQSASNWGKTWTRDGGWTYVDGTDYQDRIEYAINNLAHALNGEPADEIPDMVGEPNRVPIPEPEPTAGRGPPICQEADCTDPATAETAWTYCEEHEQIEPAMFHEPTVRERAEDLVAGLEQRDNQTPAAMTDGGTPNQMNTQQLYSDLEAYRNGEKRLIDIARTYNNNDVGEWLKSLESQGEAHTAEKILKAQLKTDYGINNTTATQLAKDHSNVEEIRETVQKAPDVTDIKGVGDGSADYVRRTFETDDDAPGDDDPEESQSTNGSWEFYDTDEYVTAQAHTEDENVRIVVEQANPGYVVRAFDNDLSRRIGYAETEADYAEIVADHAKTYENVRAARSFVRETGVEEYGIEPPETMEGDHSDEKSIPYSAVSSRDARNRLEKNFANVEEIRQATDDHLASFDGVGPTTIDNLRAELGGPHATTADDLDGIEPVEPSGLSRDDPATAITGVGDASLSAGDTVGEFWDNGPMFNEVAGGWTDSALRDVLGADFVDLSKPADLIRAFSGFTAAKNYDRSGEIVGNFGEAMFQMFDWSEVSWAWAENALGNSFDDIAAGKSAIAQQAAIGTGDELPTRELDYDPEEDRGLSGLHTVTGIGYQDHIGDSESVIYTANVDSDNDAVYAPYETVELYSILFNTDYTDPANAEYVRVVVDTATEDEYKEKDAQAGDNDRTGYSSGWVVVFDHPEAAVYGIAEGHLAVDPRDFDLTTSDEWDAWAEEVAGEIKQRNADHRGEMQQAPDEYERSPIAPKRQLDDAAGVSALDEDQPRPEDRTNPNEEEVWNEQMGEIYDPSREVDENIEAAESEGILDMDAPEYPEEVGDYRLGLDQKHTKEYRKDLDRTTTVNGSEETLTERVQISTNNLSGGSHAAHVYIGPKAAQTHTLRPQQELASGTETFAQDAAIGYMAPDTSEADDEPADPSEGREIPDQLTDIKGLGKQTAEALERNGIETPEDLGEAWANQARWAGYAKPVLSDLPQRHNTNVGGMAAQIATDLGLERSDDGGPSQMVDSDGEPLGVADSSDDEGNSDYPDAGISKGNLRDLMGADIPQPVVRMWRESKVDIPTLADTQIDQLTIGRGVDDDILREMFGTAPQDRQQTVGELQKERGLGIYADDYEVGATVDDDYEGDYTSRRMEAAHYWAANMLGWMKNGPNAGLRGTYYVDILGGKPHLHMEGDEWSEERAQAIRDGLRDAGYPNPLRIKETDDEWILFMPDPPVDMGERLKVHDHPDWRQFEPTGGDGGDPEAMYREDQLEWDTPNPYADELDDEPDDEETGIYDPTDEFDELEETSDILGIGEGRRKTLDALDEKGRLDDVQTFNTLEDMTNAVREISLAHRDGRVYMGPHEESIRAIRSTFDALPEEAHQAFLNDDVLHRRINAARKAFNRWMGKKRREQEIPSTMEAGPSNYPTKKANDTARYAREGREELEERLGKVQSGARGAKQRALNSIGTSVGEQNAKKAEEKRDKRRDEFEKGDLAFYSTTTYGNALWGVKRVNKKSVRLRRPHGSAGMEKPMSDGETYPEYDETRADLDSNRLKGPIPAEEIASFDADDTDARMSDDAIAVRADTAVEAKRIVFGDEWAEDNLDLSGVDTDEMDQPVQDEFVADDGDTYEVRSPYRPFTHREREALEPYGIVEQLGSEGTMGRYAGVRVEQKPPEDVMEKHELIFDNDPVVTYDDGHAESRIYVDPDKVVSDGVEAEGLTPTEAVEHAESEGWDVIEGDPEAVPGYDGSDDGAEYFVLHDDGAAFGINGPFDTETEADEVADELGSDYHVETAEEGGRAPLNGAPEEGQFIWFDYTDGGGMAGHVTRVGDMEALVRVSDGEEPHRYDWSTNTVTSPLGVVEGVDRAEVKWEDGADMVAESPDEPGAMTEDDIPDKDDLSDAIKARGVNRITANHLADEHADMAAVEQSVSEADDVTDLKGIGDGSAKEVRTAFGLDAPGDDEPDDGEELSVAEKAQRSKENRPASTMGNITGDVAGAVEAQERREAARKEHKENADTDETPVDMSTTADPYDPTEEYDDDKDASPDDDGLPWQARKYLGGAWSRYKTGLKEGREAIEEVEEYKEVRGDAAKAASEINEIRAEHGQDPIDFDGVDTIEKIEAMKGELLPGDVDHTFEWEDRS